MRNCDMRAIDNTGYAWRRRHWLHPATAERIRRITWRREKRERVSRTTRSPWPQFVPLFREYDIVDVVSGKRVTRLTIGPAALADSSPTSPPLSTNDPCDSFCHRTPFDPPTMLKIRVYTRTRRIITVAGTAQINGPPQCAFTVIAQI